jgi:HlyD family secretion protein
MKIKSIKRYITGKNITYAVVALAIVGGIWYFFFNPKGTGYQTVTVHPGDFLQQVSVSGTVTPSENLDLSFEQPGKVTAIKYQVGDSVKKGDLLVAEDSSDLNAQLSQMQAGVDLQKAKLAQLVDGSSPEEIQIAQDQVDSDQQALDNSYATALNALQSASTSLYNAYTTVLYMQNTYFNAADNEGIKFQQSEGDIKLQNSTVKPFVDAAVANPKSDNIDVAISNVITALNAVYADVNIARNQCDSSTYYYRVTSADKASLDTQKVAINTALTSITSAQQSINNNKVAVQQAKDSLTLKKAPPRDSDIAVYQSQIDQAQASLQNVVAQINKNRIYAPIDGVVTVLNAKLGSVISINDVAVSIISQDIPQIESFVPEINISFVKVDDEAQVVLDAYGSDVPFSAKVISIDPAETIHDGVSTYRIKLQFDNNDPRIKSGMTANVVITTDKKSQVISVPQGAIETVNGQKFVKVQQGNKAVDQPITVGSVSSLGQDEITSGLKDGDVVILPNQ